MFKSLMDALRARDLLQPAVRLTDDTLALSAEFTREVTAWLFLDEPLTLDVYETDARINEAEVEVRRLAFEHLVANPKADLATSVILLTTIIDVERIGDYAKNLAQQHDRLDGPWPTGEPYDTIAGMRDELLGLFEDARQALRDGDVGLATSVMDRQHDFGRRCEAIVDTLCATSDTPTRHAVVGSLTARYLKRISAHLSNVASGVVNPIDRIGFEPVRATGT